MPGPDSPASSYLLEAEGYKLILDLGHGSFGALQRYAKPADVDAIVITHLHADHCIDLTAYIVSLRYGGEGFRANEPDGRIPLIGPSGTRDRLEAAYDPLARKLGLHELFGFSTPTDGELGPFTVQFATMNHPVPTTAVRVTHNGRSLVYSGDTGESDELVALAQDADYLLCEASVGPDDVYVPGLHLTGKQTGEHAERAGVDTLLVTHIPPWVSREDTFAEAAAAFSGTSKLVAFGDVYDL